MNIFSPVKDRHISAFNSVYAGEHFSIHLIENNSEITRALSSPTSDNRSFSSTEDNKFYINFEDVEFDLIVHVGDKSMVYVVCRECYEQGAGVESIMAGVRTYCKNCRKVYLKGPVFDNQFFLSASAHELFSSLLIDSFDPFKLLLVLDELVDEIFNIRKPIHADFFKRLANTQNTYR